MSNASSSYSFETRAQQVVGAIHSLSAGKRLLGVLGASYLAISCVLETANPLTMTRRFQEIDARARAYSTNLNKVFGPLGFADENKDGVVSLEEKLAAFKQASVAPRLSNKPHSDHIIGIEYPTSDELNVIIGAYSKRDLTPLQALPHL